MKQLLLFFLVLSSASLNAYTISHNKWKYNISGYIKYEAFCDTRQVVGSQNDELLYFPAAPLLDVNRKDINKKGQFTATAFDTRLRAEIESPSLCSTKLSGLLEVDFLGIDVPNILNLRHAFMSAQHNCFTLGAGHTWHPFCLDLYYPDMLSNNNGAPFEAYSRNPQVRVTYHTDTTRCILAALSQVDFVNDGPFGPRSTYLRNAIVPNLVILFQHEVSPFTFGAGAEYKRLVPRLVTNKNVKADESINSFGSTLFCVFKTPDISLISKIMVGQNMSNMFVQGGYAVHSIDPITDHRTYTNIAACTWWSEIRLLWCMPFEPACFMGIGKNLGSRNSIIPNHIDQNGILQRNVYGFGTTISSTIRIAPRIKWFYHNLCVGMEIEYSFATYGTLDAFAHPRNTKGVHNIRTLGAIYYTF